MPTVQFDEDDAERLLSLLRGKMISAGFGFVDETAMQLFATGEKSLLAVSPQTRLRRYLDVIKEYVDTHTDDRVAHAVDGLNEQLREGHVDRVVVQLPETAPFQNQRYVPLEDLVISRRDAEGFQSSLRNIMQLVYDGYLPDHTPESPDGPSL